MNAAEIQRRLKASYLAAMKLDRIGMGVRVRRDDGAEMLTTLASLPWSLGHGAWVAKVVGISGGYDCARITPASRGATPGRGPARKVVAA